MRTISPSISGICFALLLVPSLARAQDAPAPGSYTLAEKPGAYVTLRRSPTVILIRGALDDGVRRDLYAPIAPRAPLAPLTEDATAYVGTGSWVFPVDDAPGTFVELRPLVSGKLEAVRRTTSDLLGVTHLSQVRLVLYPGEAKRDDGTTTGHIYVIGGQGESYDCCAGPPPAEASVGTGGHHVGETPAGDYTLAAQEHHVTSSWPNSTIPWGATLEQKQDGFVYYTDRPGHTVQVTGPKGVMTKALGGFWDRSTPAQQADMGPRVDFMNDTSDLFDDQGNLVSPWTKNDFGDWAWDLVRKGSRTPYYVHTTPDDEAAFAQGKEQPLQNSHGCVHLQPSQRNEMMAKGYLAENVPVKVMPYGQAGPP